MVYNWIEELVSVDGCEVVTYGIEAKTENERKTLKDITDDKGSIISLVNAFNKNELELIHFEQAVEDFLYDLTI